MIDDLVKRLRNWTTDWNGAKMVPGEPPRDGLHCDIIDEAADRIEALEAALDEMTRRRDEWRKKAEGFDAVRLALREKVGAPWPPNMSRVLWAGIAADEKKRADDAEAALLAADELAREISVMMDQCEDGDGYTAIAAHNVATALIAYRSAADGK